MPDNPNDHDLLIRLDQKVDTLHDKVSVLTDDHEDRIRSLEKRVWGASAIVSVVVTGMGWLIQLLYSLRH